jgi:hypothetical protein
MKRSNLFAFAAAALSLVLWVGSASAEDKKAEAKTVSGKSACATCEGVTADGHSIMLVDDSGNRWVLTGEGDDYKKAHGVRQEGKKMTATLTDDEPETKKDADGKEYKVAKVKEIKVDAES